MIQRTVSGKATQGKQRPAELPRWEARDEWGLPIVSRDAMTATAVKERPLLMSAPMVRAIFAGRKWQTRRLLVQPRRKDGCQLVPELLQRMGVGHACRHGAIGDRMWIRETWGLFGTLPKDGPERAQVYYRATDGDLHECRYQLWRPSIHMPRWASRLLLDITDVRIERLQEISADDAVAEGIERVNQLGILRTCGWKDYSGQRAGFMDPVESFRTLWDSINGKRAPWESNPWVFPISFEAQEVVRS